jgi:small subunit ribosomal protein S23
VRFGPKGKTLKRKASKAFQPLPIAYPEDRLRKEFFADHPWELARPRMVLEDDGKDGQRRDWASIIQESKPLDGERYMPRGPSVHRIAADLFGKRRAEADVAHGERGP